jgi:DNA-binding SARP family transcriptional activator
MLEIRALGTPQLAVNGRDLSSISLRAQVMLVYLSLEGGKHSRNYLATMLWPDSPEAKALTSLRVLLSELRKLVPDNLDIERSVLGIDPEGDLYLDVVEFEGLLKTGEIKKAFKLYRGELLAGVYIPGSPEFENWRRWENERVRLLALNQAEKVIRKEFGMGNYREVEECCREVIRIDPINETANLYLILVQAVTGQRSAAAKHIKEYKTSLKENLGMDLPEEITKIQEVIFGGDLESIINNLTPSHDLPSSTTSFIGRVAEIDAISKLITNPDCRLISIIGPGGMGKTRLAIEAVRSTLLEFPDGSFFVPMDTVTNEDGIIPTLAEALQFRLGTIVSEIDPDLQLFDYLKHRRLALILDGFEHLTESGHLLHKLLVNAPGLKLVITSRHKLNLPEEWIFPLEGLHIPENIKPDGDLPEALALFFSRTKQNLPINTITAEDMRQAARICRLVEGMPLGIELAAAWTSVLDFSEIADEIMENYGFLEDCHPDPSSKSKSMRAVFQSSWSLLKESQQTILLRLSVFRGGFSRQAAREISKASLTDLSILMDRSLLRKNAPGQFEIHPIVSQFCRELISNQTVIWKEIQNRHLIYYADYLSQRVPDLFRLDPANTRMEVQNAISNILAAAEFLLEEYGIPADPNIIQDIFSYYCVRGWHEGAIVFHDLADQVEQRIQTGSAEDLIDLARLQSQEAFYLSNLGLVEESELISQKSLPILKGSGCSRELAICLNNLGINAMYRGEYDLSLDYLNQAVELGREPDCYSLPSYYLWIGYNFFLCGEYQKGLDSLYISRDIFARHNSEWGQAFSYSKIGLALDALGDFQEASRHHHKSLTIFKRMDDFSGQGYALSRMSLGALLLGDFQAALEFGQQGLEQFKEVGHRWGICASLIRIGYARLGLGDLEDAEATLLQALDRSFQDHLDPLSLHAIGGIAVQRLLSGDIQGALELIVYVYFHPKTPAIYKELNLRWFDRSSIEQWVESAEMNQPPLDALTQEILAKKSNILENS